MPNGPAIDAEEPPRIGDFLRGEIEKRKLSLTSLAEATGLSLEFLSRLINNHKNARLPVVVRIAEALDLDPYFVAALHARRAVYDCQRKKAHAVEAVGPEEDEGLGTRQRRQGSADFDR